MSEETKSNLEPIEEGDLDLKEKFIGGVKTPEKVGESAVEIPKPEQPHLVESNVERREGSVEKDASYSKILSKVGSATHLSTSDDDVKNDAQAANSGMDAESKITNLVKLAEVKGIPHAVKVARHIEDNYTLDEFHDRLLGQELHDALVKKGMIKEI